MGGAITDDHYFVIRNLRIPCVDIINYDEEFGDYWHTLGPWRSPHVAEKSTPKREVQKKPRPELPTTPAGERVGYFSYGLLYILRCV